MVGGEELWAPDGYEGTNYIKRRVIMPCLLGYSRGAATRPPASLRKITCVD